MQLLTSLLLAMVKELFADCCCLCLDCQDWEVLSEKALMLVTINFRWHPPNQRGHGDHWQRRHCGFFYMFVQWVCTRCAMHFIMSSWHLCYHHALVGAFSVCTLGKDCNWWAAVGVAISNITLTLISTGIVLNFATENAQACNYVRVTFA